MANQKIIYPIFLIAALALLVVGCTPDSPPPSPPPSSPPPITKPAPPSPPPPKNLSVDKLREVAKKSTVFISLSDKIVGSGVIIGQRNNTIYVLTASHVIGIKPGENEDPYKITTNEDEVFEVGYSIYDITVKQLPKTDLSVLSIKSNGQPRQKDKFAKLATFISPGMSAYIFGYLPCSLSVKRRKQKLYQFSEGDILNFKSIPTIDIATQLGGYDAYYNNNTIKGMSGSPVFDALGRVIAIHAKTDQEKEPYNSENCQPLDLKPSLSFGKNWGISIKTFLNLKPYWPLGLETVLQTDSFLAGEGNRVQQNSSSNSTKIVSPGKINCGPFRQLDEVCPNWEGDNPVKTGGK